MPSKTKMKEIEMARRFKDFGADVPETTEPITFKLHDEEFTCMPEVQAAVVLELASLASGDVGPEGGTVILDFYKNVLEDESYERFNALIHSKKIVRMEKLGEIAGWLLEEYTARPEEQPEAS
jgi:hypothetical protein